MKPGIMLHRKLAQQARQSQIHSRIAGLGEDSAVCGAAELAARIWLGNADALEFENVEFVEKVQALQAEADHALPEIEFLRGAVPGGVDDDFGLVAGLVEDGEFGGWGWRGAFDAPDTDSGIVFSI
jgi:hypothetical protein